MHIRAWETASWFKTALKTQFHSAPLYDSIMLRRVRNCRRCYYYCVTFATEYPGNR